MRIYWEMERKYKKIRECDFSGWEYQFLVNYFMDQQNSKK